MGILQDSVEVPTAATLSLDDIPDEWNLFQLLDHDEAALPFPIQQSRNKRKRRRQSRPASVLDALTASAQSHYSNPATGKVDLSYRSQHLAKAGQPQQRGVELSAGKRTEPPRQLTTLHSILAGYLHHQLKLNESDSQHTFSVHEQSVLCDNGFASTSVASWATCLSAPSSLTAVSIFKSDEQTPPLFVLLLVLRRRVVSTFALGIIYRHINERVKSEPLPWYAIKLLSIRLLRHARKVWPESIPWVASLFTDQTGMFFENSLHTVTPQEMSDITSFSNTLLLLLSLPSNITPILGAISQEKAQFKVLQFMASRTPAITVTRSGFRAISRTQLAHPKTAEEKEWAKLKGPSWPPWKDNRTAMDEDKSYEFGASRAAKIFHRMYEAGYRGQTWEAMAEVYTGWDTDLSPTIQTRTSLPHVSSESRHQEYLTILLWAGRVRTTRTRREAWACFLAYELSNAPASNMVYLAMFEKLHSYTMERSPKQESLSTLDDELNPDEDLDNMEAELLPGDMKEVLTDPTSPLHYVYLSEPVPTVQELFNRMYKRDVRPSNRLLAYLLEIAPTFETCVSLLEAAADDFDGGVGRLLYGQWSDDNTADTTPNYLIAAFIKALCRFGRFGPSVRAPGHEPLFISPERHTHELRQSNSYYMMEYAHALLYRYQPLYRPAWTTYMNKVSRSAIGATVHTNGKHTVQSRRTTSYVITWDLVECMEKIDLDVDDSIFQIVCRTTTSAARAITTSNVSEREAHQVSSTASPRLRSLFHRLVGANMDTTVFSTTTNHDESTTIPPHIPGTAVLHGYVLALAALRDYEGLYSFSTWLTKHYVEVTARAKAHHSGNKWLHRTLVALRAAVTGLLEEEGSGQHKASDEIVELIRGQIDTVEEWGGWPGQRDVDLYLNKVLWTVMPRVGGR
jgi:hypothetical protein